MTRQEYVIEIDEQADAAYVRVSDAPVAQTNELTDGIIVDFGENQWSASKSLDCAIR